MGLKANGVTLYGHGGCFPIAERPTPKAVDTSQHQSTKAPLHAGASQQQQQQPPPPCPKGGDSSGEAGGGSRHRAGQVRVRVRVKG